MAVHCGIQKGAAETLKGARGNLIRVEGETL